MNDANCVSTNEAQETGTLLMSKAPPKKETPVIPLPIEKRLPAPPPSEFPISTWQMPPAQEEYIKGKDNDCL